jgi:mRNA interferase MazF
MAEELASLKIGDVVSAVFPSHQPSGNEQEGLRPAVVVGLPERLGKPRFDVVLLAPLTRYRGHVWVIENPRLYPIIRQNSGTVRLSFDGVVLLDQVRVLSLERVTYRIGQLTSSQYQPIKDALLHMLEG